MPVCLPDKVHVEYEEEAALIITGLVKSTLNVTLRSDEACENRIRHVDFDPDTNLCTFESERDLYGGSVGVS